MKNERGLKIAYILNKRCKTIPSSYVMTTYLAIRSCKGLLAFASYFALHFLDNGLKMEVYGLILVDIAPIAQ